MPYDDDDYIDHTPPPVVPAPAKKRTTHPWRRYQELRPGTILVPRTEQEGQLELFPTATAMPQRHRRR